MAKPKKTSAAEVDLDKFLGEMTSLIKKRFDRQARRIDDLGGRVDALENNDLGRRITSLEDRKQPESIVEEKFSGIEESIESIGKRLTALEEKNAGVVESIGNVNERLKALEGKVGAPETDDPEPLDAPTEEPSESGGFGGEDSA